MTKDEIKRYEQYQELKDEEERYHTFLESIEINDERRLNGIFIELIERGIVHSDEQFQLPEEFTEELYDYIYSFIISKIDKIELKIKAL